jgi:hypothetical protein
MVKKQKAAKGETASAPTKTRSPVKKATLQPVASVPDEDVQEAEQKRARLEENLWTIEKQVGGHILK